MVLPLHGTLIGSMIMSSMGYPFGWNWDSGPSATLINFIGCIPPSSYFPYLGGSNVSRDIPFLRGTNLPRISPFSRGNHDSSGLPFLDNVNIHGI